jgi:RHS repeat-associated protein
MSQHRSPAPLRNPFIAVVLALPRGPDSGGAVGNGASGHQDLCGHFGCATDTQGNAPVADRYQFTAGEYDAAGLQYNRARCYDPTPGRWLTLDPMAFL